MNLARWSKIAKHALVSPRGPGFELMEPQPYRRTRPLTFFGLALTAKDAIDAGQFVMDALAVPADSADTVSGSARTSADSHRSASIVTSPSS